MSKTRILVVENEAIVAEDIKAKLERFGYEVPATAFSGAEAVKLAASVQPDLILMDIRMPGPMDGMDAAAKIRESRDIPVIFLTAFADKETIDRAKITAPFGYIVKPFTEQELQTAIEIGLYKHRMELKLRQSETKYRELIENLNEAVYSIDLQGHITYMSSVIKELVGYTAEELTGRPYTEFIHPDDLPRIRESFQKLLTKAIGPNEYRIFTKGGEVRWIHTHSRPVHDGKTAAGIQGALIDITERKQAEELLRQKQEMLARTESFAHVGSWEWDVATDTVMWSDELFRIFQRNPADGAPSFAEHQKFYYPEDMQRLRVAVEAAVNNGTPYEMELRAIRKDGETRVCLARGYAEMGPGRSATRLFGSLQDITESQRMAEALQESEVRFRELFNRMSSGVAVYEAIDNGGDFIFRDFNSAAEKIEKVSRKDILGKRVSEVFPGGKAFGVFEVFQSVWQTGNPEYLPQNIYEDERGLKSWRESWVFKLPAGEIVAIYSDITESKRAEEALRESEARYRRITEGLTDYQCTVRIEQGRAVETTQSPACERVTGYTAQEYAADPYLWIQMVTPEDRDRVREHTRRILAGENVPAIEHRIVRKDGAVRWVIDTTILFKDASGRLLSYDIVISDITDRKQAEEKIRETDARFRLLADNMLDAALILDWDGRVLFANKTALRMAEFAPSVPAEKLNVLAFVHPDSRAAAVADLNKIHTTGGRILSEYRMQTRHGAEKWVESLGVRIAYEGAEAELLTLRDITERKRMEEALWESQERYRVLFAEMLNGFALFQIISNEQGRPADSVLLAVNPAFERLTGLRADVVLGKTAHDVLPPSFWVDTYEKILLTNQPIRLESYLQQFDRYLEVTAFCPKPGQCATIIGDITERKRAELAMLKINEELEERVRLRTADLESTNRELDAFSYSVSHDLRAPLRAIGGFSRILVEEFAASLPDPAQHYLDLVVSNARHMGQLVDDLLSFSRLSRQPLKTQIVNPEAIVREVLERLKPDIESRQVEFAIGKLPICNGDPSLLRHVFTNLLSNAVKFTRKKPVAHIEVGAREEGEEHVFFIKDNGTGFDMQYANKLFGVFQRLHRAEDFEGTGVGLAIIQRIVHRHGGRVWAEAEPDKGATFYFSLKKEIPHES